MIEDLQHIPSTKKDLRKFGSGLGIILILIGCFLLWKKSVAFQYFFTAGIILLCLAVFWAIIFKPVHWIWMRIAAILSWMMTRVILSLLFYFILTPIAWIARLFGKRFLELKWDKTADTYWNYRQMEEFKDDSCEKQF